MISPDDLREFVLPGHKLMADMSHKAGPICCTPAASWT